MGLFEFGSSQKWRKNTIQVKEAKTKMGGTNFIEEDTKESHSNRGCGQIIKEMINCSAFMILVGFFVFEIVQCAIKFTDRPTYLSTEIRAQYEASFPSVTFCPASGYKNDAFKVRVKKKIKINITEFLLHRCMESTVNGITLKMEGKRTGLEITPM